MNLFKITNRAELAIPYRLLEIQGLPQTEHYDKQVHLLAKMVAYETRNLAALVWRDGTHHVAIPADASLPTLEQRLTPHVATLVPGASAVLDLARLQQDDAAIAVTFLRYALQTPLWRSPELWGVGRAYYYKRPLNAQDTAAGVDIYPGFVWNVVVAEGEHLFLALDLHARYVERRWLSDHLNGNDPRVYLRRYFLYHFGHQWYLVQFWGLTGRSIAQQQFVAGDNGVADVFSYTHRRWRDNEPPWIRDLDPNSPAIIYRSRGSEVERYGALGLCKLALSTADAEAAGLHRSSILDPHVRFERIRETVHRHFQHAELAGHPITIAPDPAEVTRQVFSLPPLRFGHGRVLAVGGAGTGTETAGHEAVSLEQLGRRRLQLMLDPTAGPLDTSPFDAQYLVAPQSLPRSIVEDFTARFTRAMREVSGRRDYTPRRLIYDDQQATSLRKQVRAIEQVLGTGRVTRGYALLILPERAKPDLHNYIKRVLWPNLQFQCAMAGKIRRYYRSDPTGRGYGPAPDPAHRLESYVRNCALGMLVVNRKWPWSLASPLHYDVYVGVDVLNQMVGLTFLYRGGETIIFRNARCRQKERLTTPQLRDLLAASLRTDLRALGFRPRSLVVHRDGRAYPSEIRALRAAAAELQGEGLLALDAVIGVVDIRKTSADHVRLVEGEGVATAHNPIIASYRVLRPREGIVCTTGWPFRFPGTAKPLTALITEGPLRIEWVLEDLCALAQLAFTAPDKCARLPITIKLNDFFLEPIAGDADNGAALYETEELDEPAAAGGGDRAGDTAYIAVGLDPESEGGEPL